MEAACGTRAAPFRTADRAARTWPADGHGPRRTCPAPRPCPWPCAGCRPDPAAKWRGLPDGAAGAIVFAWRPARPPEPAPGALHSTAHFDPLPAALSLLAVSADGERVPWFGGRAKVRTVGSRAGAVFEARPGEAAEPVHVAEGEVSALALALAPWAGPGAVYAAGGTSGMKRLPELPGADPVVLHCDGAPGGRGQVERARHAIEAAGRECRIEWYAGDPAHALADWLAERSGIREASGEARDDADRGAWVDLLREAT